MMQAEVSAYNTCCFELRSGLLQEGGHVGTTCAWLPARRADVGRRLLWRLQWRKVLPQALCQMRPAACDT